MSPPKLPWFRWYSETVRDPKLRRLKPATRWLWAAILTAASDSPERGYLLLADGHPYDEHDLADLAALSLAETRRGLADLEQLGLISTRIHHETETKWIPKWNARQPESDSSTERVRAHRARKRADQGTLDLGSNDDETFQERSMQQIRNAPELETEIDPFLSSPASLQKPPPNPETINEAAAILGARDVASAKARGTRIRATEHYQTTCAAKHLPAVTALATDHPDWTPIAIADAIEFTPDPTPAGPTPPTPPPIPPPPPDPRPTAKRARKAVAKKQTATARASLKGSKKP